MWFPQSILRQTNWLHWVDALRNHYIREMTMSWELSVLCLDYFNVHVALAAVMKTIMSTNITQEYNDTLDKTFSLLIELIQLMMSKGYC